MSITLDEAILHAEEVATEQERLMSRYDAASGYARSRNEAIRTESAKKCEKCAAEHKQLAEWLRELQERRKEPEITYCKDCRKHNVKVGFDENFHTVWKEDACPLVDWRGKAKAHEFDYQYCAFAERRTDD